MAIYTSIYTIISILTRILLYPFLKCLSVFVGLIRKKAETDYSCNIVLVTGAAQGIGKALAVEVSYQFGKIPTVSLLQVYMYIWLQ